MDYAVACIMVDGEKMEGCVIPYVKGKTDYQVEIVMG